MNYEINEDTLAVISINDKKSNILEDDREFSIYQNAYEIMDESCIYFGSSYNGRKEGTKSILGVNYKVPIVVEDSKNMIFFPTASPTDNECIWVALNNIKFFEKIDYNQTRIVFKNNKEILVPVSYRSVENQILRATRLESLLRNRKNS